MDKSIDLLEEEKKFQNIKTMDIIRNYLQLKHKLNAAADFILKEQEDIHKIAKMYSLEYSILHKKISIMESLEKFIDDKIKYEKAVETVMKGEAVISDSGKKHGVDIPTLCNEIGWFYETRDEKYEYDRSLDPTRIFTFKQEMLLLKYLELWIKQKIPFCSCASCVMEELLNIAYKFAKQNKIKYPSMWNIQKRASATWLINYEMTYSHIISQLFSHNDCFRAPIPKMNPSCYCYILKLRKKDKEICKTKKKLLSYY
ncbi:uncharacterized protein LOC105252537 [Camponotus floridanus]|nr:uncharacterized protein LOC105252537 [Camponotus floridanus]